MTTQRVLRAHEPRDLISLVPYRLGFRPAASVVLMGMTMNEARGTSEVGLVARADLAGLAHDEHGPDLAADLAGHLLDSGADGVFVVIYTSAPHGAPGREGLERVRQVLDAALAWMPPVEPWVVGPDGWGHLSCACCPPGGRALDELLGTEIGATLVLEGVGPAPSRERLGTSRVPRGPARSAARRAARAERARHRDVAAACGGAPLVRGAAFGVPGAAALRDQGPLDRWREEGARLWDRSVRRPEDDPAPPSDLGRLLVFMADRFLRDAIIAAVLAGVGRSPASYLSDAAIGAAHDAGRPPRHDVFEPAMALATAVAAHAADGDAAPALGLLAFLAWWAGESARADVVARQALDEEPGHHLAELVVVAVEGSLPPPWYERAGPRYGGR
ncbi:DUF4192 domain-containing protein [Georgenia sp. SYP-B2076]|uniref:DUF4192 domain-containing protein n=1 Tax=Georgenia sp. SYP-B2076 TaxID=2495881 RepID=UPI000F8EBCE9|nr:DUF4192 domain-containing protein [Georgenia sp. SYP-B2076]